jgi:hypothetical protein
VKSGRFDNEYIVTLRFPHITVAQQQVREPAKAAVARPVVGHAPSGPLRVKNRSRRFFRRRDQAE